MNCLYCRLTIAPRARFCHYCGQLQRRRRRWPRLTERQLISILLRHVQVARPELLRIVP